MVDEIILTAPPVQQQVQQADQSDIHKILTDAMQIVNQSISSMDESKKSVHYISHDSIKSTAKFEEEQEIEDLIQEKVDVSNVVQRYPTTINSIVGSGHMEQIKLALEKLEAYSLRSSEDVNDSIEQLVSCINSNTAALQRAMDDLKLSYTSNEAPFKDQIDRQGMIETANKILFQFQNFSDYCKDEVNGILMQLTERRKECDESLALVENNLIPA